MGWSASAHVQCGEDGQAGLKGLDLAGRLWAEKVRGPGCKRGRGRLLLLIKHSHWNVEAAGGADRVHGWCARGGVNDGNVDSLGCTYGFSTPACWFMKW